MNWAKASTEKINESEQQQQQQQRVSPSPPPQTASERPPHRPLTPFEQARLKSKSTSTLRYTQSDGMGGPTQQPNAFLQTIGMKSIPSNANVNGQNLTFRDMLDEGDGNEGDLNLRHRNQQWKDFRTFSHDWNERNGAVAVAEAGRGTAGAAGSAGGNVMLQKMKMMQQEQQRQQQQRARADGSLRNSLSGMAQAAANDEKGSAASGGGTPGDRDGAASGEGGGGGLGIKRGSDSLVSDAVLEEGDDERSCATERDGRDSPGDHDGNDRRAPRTTKRPSINLDTSSEQQPQFQQQQQQQHFQH
mmetsp:Transcript_22408/g.44671  ORF Transcript_22408/g.44671 Transcript_22408/m.44671 type:complete len:303 (+) Transcript_22408:180-1088(+)